MTQDTLPKKVVISTYVFTVKTSPTLVPVVDLQDCTIVLPESVTDNIRANLLWEIMVGVGLRNANTLGNLAHTEAVVNVTGQLLCDNPVAIEWIGDRMQG